MNRPTQLLSAGLRVLTLGIKYIYSILIIKFYGLESVGSYNVLLGYCSLLIYVMGLEYYYHAGRQYPLLDKDAKRRALMTQLLLYGVIYALLALPIWFFFETKFQLGLHFLLLLAASHMSTEIYRVLYSIKRPVIGAIVFSMASGLWAVPLIIGFALGYYPPIGMLLLVNSGVALLSIGMGLVILHREIGFRFERKYFDLPGLREGLTIALPLLLSTLAYRSSEIFGRFVLEATEGLDAAGIFASYQILASAVLIIVESGIGVIAVPHLIELRQRSAKDYGQLKKATFKQIILVASLGTIASILSIRFILTILNKVELTHQLNVYYLIAAAYFMLTIAIYYSVLIQVEKYDRELVTLNIASSLLNAGLAYVLVLKLGGGIIGAALCLFIWAAIQLLSKAQIARRAAQKALRHSLLDPSEV